MKLNAEDLLKMGIIDAIIQEPTGGAHTDPEETARSVKRFILEQLAELKELPTEHLLENRYHKFRRMGEVVEHG